MPVSQREEGLGNPVQRRSKDTSKAISSQPQRCVYVFDDFSIDSRERRLWHGDEPLALPPKAFDLLFVLVEHSGQLIEKKALLQAVWRDSFVEEGNLSVYISILRKVFSKESPEREYIETVPKTGYRFNATVTQRTIQQDPLLPVVSEPETPPPGREDEVSFRGATGTGSTVIHDSRVVPTKFLWVMLVGILAAVTITALAMIAIHGRRVLSKTTLTTAESRPLTSVPGFFASPTFSPDGKSVAYAWRGSTEEFRSVFVQDISSDTRNKLTAGLGDFFSPAWSPKGDEIAFLHTVAGSKSIEINAVEVEMPHELRRVATINSVKSAFHDSPSLAWSPDGQWLLTTEKDDETGSSSLVLLSSDGSKKQVLTHPPAQTVDDNAVFSPNGSLIAFLRARGPSSGEINIIPVSGGAERVLPFQIHSIDGLTWSPDGQSLLVSSARALSVGNFWRVSLNGDPPVALSSLSAHTSDPVISLRAHRLAYVEMLRSVSLWTSPVDGRGNQSKVVASEFIDSAPDYSPDGSQIAFESDRSGATEIWIAKKDGSGARRVTNIFGPMTGSPHWSPNGKVVAFDSRVKGNSAVFVVDSSGGTPVRVTTGAFDSADNVVPSWSHDGQFLYFSSNRTGRWEVWKKRIDGDEEAQLTRDGGFNGVESVDGKTLYYVGDTDKTTVWQVPLSGGKRQQVTEPLGPGMWGYWALSGENLFYLQKIRPGSSPAAIFRLSLKTGTKTKLGQTQFGVNISDKGLAVSPDGAWLLYTQRDVDRTNIMLSEGWE